MLSIGRKLDILRAEQDAIKDEMRHNNELGAEVTSRVEKEAKQQVSCCCKCIQWQMIDIYLICGCNNSIFDGNIFWPFLNPRDEILVNLFFGFIKNAYYGLLMI